MDDAKNSHILDRCCDSFTFPMLDNGYVYLRHPAFRLSITSDWALRYRDFWLLATLRLARRPCSTFSSRLHNRDAAGQYVGEQAMAILEKNPYKRSRFFSPFKGTHGKTRKHGASF